MKYQFHSSPSELIPIAKIPELYISADDVATNDLMNHLYQAVLIGELTPRTNNGLPRSVDSCIELARSLPVLPWIKEYLRMVPGADLNNIFTTPYHHLTSKHSDQWLRCHFAKGLIKHENLSETDLSVWLNAMGIECEFVGSSGIDGTQEPDHAPPPKNPLQPAIILHSTKEPRKARRIDRQTWS